jgi:hypothetical protein
MKQIEGIPVCLFFFILKLSYRGGGIIFTIKNYLGVHLQITIDSKIQKLFLHIMTTTTTSQPPLKTSSHIQKLCIHPTPLLYKHDVGVGFIISPIKKKSRPSPVFFPILDATTTTSSSIQQESTEYIMTSPRERVLMSHLSEFDFQFNTYTTLLDDVDFVQSVQCNHTINTNTKQNHDPNIHNIQDLEQIIQCVDLSQI